MDELDLDAYFERIGWGGGTPADFETLSGLLDAHMHAVPFENLDVLLRRPIRLDLEGLQRKLVRARRGGYCFEHATLFGAVLEKLGFEIARHTARVVLVAPREQAPRTHMFLVATLPQGRFVVDPGFGSQSAPFPVPLADAVDDGATHWLQRDGRWWVLRMRSPDKVIDAWASTLDADNEADFVLGNHYTSTYPDSAFVNRLMLHALTPQGSVSVMNRDVTFRREGEIRSKVQLADRRELRDLLGVHFGFDLPEAGQLRIPAVPEWK